MKQEIELDKHFTATSYILRQDKPLTLLHFHKKLQSWLPPGGHIENNETPKEAAMREIVEETGIQPQHLEFIHNGDKPRILDERAEMLEMPHYLLSELIEPGHYHLDWIYFVRINPSNFDPEARDEEFRWFSVEELKKEEDIFNNVRELAIIGIEKFSIEN